MAIKTKHTVEPMSVRRMGESKTLVLRMTSASTSSHPSLLRGEDRLRYMEQARGVVSPARAKALIKEIARARVSWERAVIKRMKRK